jgi:uncharacterized protein YhaN
VRITDVRIDGFGVWTDLKVEALNDGLTVFYGANEAGKTTLMQFIRTIFYGFSPSRRVRYTPPVHGGRPGGSVTIVAPNGKFTVTRHATRIDANDSTGHLVVTADDGAVHGQLTLNHLMGGVDEHIYSNIFAIGLRELQELSALNDSAAADQIYKLTTGLDRVSIIDVMREMESSRERLLSPGEKTSKIIRLLQRKERLEREVEEHLQRGRRWTSLHAERTEIDGEIRELRSSSAELERQVRITDAAIQVRKPWQERGRIRKAIADLGEVKKLEDGAAEQLDRINAQLIKERQDVVNVKKTREELRAKALATPINAKILAQGSRIEAVQEHAEWIASLEHQIDRAKIDIQQIQEELKTKSGVKGVANDKAAHMPDIPRKKLLSLLGPARAVRQHSRRLREVKLELNSSREEAREFRQHLDEVLDETGTSDLKKSLLEAGDRVNLLRRRLQLDEQLDQLERNRREIDDQYLESLDGQLLSLPTLLALGLMFVLGAALLLSSIIFPMITNYFDVDRDIVKLLIMGVGGIVIMLVTAFMKYNFEHTAREELATTKRSLAQAERQVETILAERKEIDSQLPKVVGSIDGRLKDAETELEQLQAMVPVDDRRRSARDRLAEAKRFAGEASSNLREAKIRWKTALKALGLPEDFSPRSIRPMASLGEELYDLRRRLSVRREELEHRENELAGLVLRIEQVFADIGIEPASEGPQERLRQLVSLLHIERQNAAQRSELKKTDKRLRREQMKQSRELIRVNRRRREFLIASGAKDEDAFRLMVRRLATLRDLQKQLEVQDAAIRGVIGAIAEESAIGQVMTDFGEYKLEHRREQLLANIAEGAARLAHLNQRVGELVQEMKMLAEDRSLSKARLELAFIEKQLEKDIRRWQVLTATHILLEEVRKVYETNRQPVTLCAASKFLAKLTSEQYVRIWTPMGEDSLRIEDSQGNSLPLEVLSRGTRETVYMAIRLALSTMYAERGVILPIVLDDVLVNLDVKRVKAAVNVIRDFARTGHQVLMFTCHEHVMKLFRSAKVEIRTLPAHRDELPQKSEVDVETPAIPLLTSPEPISQVVLVNPANAASFTIVDHTPRSEPVKRRTYSDDELIRGVSDFEPTRMRKEPEVEINLDLFDQLSRPLLDEKIELAPVETASSRIDEIEYRLMEEEPVRPKASKRKKRREEKPIEIPLDYLPTLEEPEPEPDWRELLPRKTEPVLSHRAEWNEDLDLAPGFELPADWESSPNTQSAPAQEIELASDENSIRFASPPQSRRGFTWDEPERWWEDEKEVA